MSPTPKIGRPRSLHEREQQEIAEAVERHAQELEDQALSKPLDLSPEEIATAEREKRELIEELKATRPAKPGPERGAPESLSSHPISDIGGHAPERIADVEDTLPVEPEVVRTPVLSVEEQEAALSELALLEQEVAALEAERVAAERASAAQLKAIKTDTDVKLALIAKKRKEAEARAKEAREAAARAELADRALAAQREAEANRQRRQATAEEQRRALLDARPLLDDKRTFGDILSTAKRVVKQIATINKQIGPGLRSLAALAAWEDTPTHWPVDLRKKMGSEVILPARELVRIIDNYFREDAGATANIRLAEQLLQTWRPGDPIATLMGELGVVNDDALRYIGEQATRISTRFEEIEVEGKAYVASGDPVPEVVILLPHETRIAEREYMKTKHLHSTQQTHAQLDIGSTSPADRK
jgi:hypothetical protein